MFKTFFVTNIGKASFFFCKKEAIAVQFLFVFIEKKSLQCEVSFAIHDMHHLTLHHGPNRRLVASDIFMICITLHYITDPTADWLQVT